MELKKIIDRYAKTLDKYHIAYQDDMSDSEIYHLMEDVLSIRSCLSYSDNDDDLQDMVILESLIDYLDDFDFDED